MYGSSRCRQNVRHYYSKRRTEETRRKADENNERTMRVVCENNEECTKCANEFRGGELFQSSQPFSSATRSGVREMLKHLLMLAMFYTWVAIQSNLKIIAVLFTVHIQISDSVYYICGFKSRVC